MASDPRFGGLQLQPRGDLLPLRVDPTSGLWELVYLPAGVEHREEPAISTDGGYELTGDTGMVVVLLPGGTFWMGAQKQDPSGPNYDPEASPEESPVHEVTLSPFYCGKYELTEEQMLRIAGPGAHSKARPEGEDPKPITTFRLPCVSVSQRRLQSILQPMGLRLPTEAQWEYACRAGTSGPFSFGPRAVAGAHCNIADEFAKRAGAPWRIEPGVDDGHHGLAPIGSLAPNAFGLHDVHGNVAEMVDDPAGRYLFPTASGDGRLPSKWGETWLAYRGGTFAHNLHPARSGGRALRESPDFSSGSVGARLVVPLQL